MLGISRFLVHMEWAHAHDQFFCVLIPDCEPIFVLQY